jgi:hypothetical protein
LTVQNGHYGIFSHNDVVDQRHTQGEQRMIQKICRSYVLCGRNGNTTRMIVRQEHGGGITLNGILHNLSGIDVGLIDRSDVKQFATK